MFELVLSLVFKTVFNLWMFWLNRIIHT